jgi:hypothetical protein
MTNLNVSTDGSDNFTTVVKNHETVESRTPTNWIILVEAIWDQRSASGDQRLAISDWLSATGNQRLAISDWRSD